MLLFLLTIRVLADSISGFVKSVSSRVDCMAWKNLRFPSESRSSSHDEFPEDEFLKFLLRVFHKIHNFDLDLDKEC